MAQLGSLKRIVQQDWKFFKELLWSNEPGDDCFRLLDYIAVVSATRFVPKNNRQRKILPIWKVYRWTVYYTAVYLTANAIAHRKGNFTEIAWYFIIALEACMAHVKDFIILNNSKQIQDAQNYINRRATIVTDRVFDPKARKDFYRKVKIMFGAISLAAINMIQIMTIPNAQIDELFALPNMDTFLNVLYYLFKFTVSPQVTCKILCGTVLIASVLEGFKTELLIFANQLESTVKKAQTVTLDSKIQRDGERDKVVFNNLQKLIPQKIAHHIELLENIQNFKPLVEFFFFVLYFHAMALIGTYIFVILQTEFSSGSAMMLMAVAAYFAKCYFWCWVISSFQDVNKLIEIHILKLMTSIPHFAEHHSEYIELRTMLMIMMIRTQSSAAFSCGGLQNISVELFGNLLNVSYSVIMFLLNMN